MSFKTDLDYNGIGEGMVSAVQKDSAGMFQVWFYKLA